MNKDGYGSFVVEDGGSTLRLTGNVWKSIELPYTITAETVLEFDFRSSAQGDIHAIGFDTDFNQDESRSFTLYGTQQWGLRQFHDYANEAPGTVHYRIPIGEFYTGNMLRLFFINDHDVASPDAESVYSNISISESAALVNISGSNQATVGADYQCH